MHTQNILILQIVNSTYIYGIIELILISSTFNFGFFFGSVTNNNYNNNNNNKTRIHVFMHLDRLLLSKS